MRREFAIDREIVLAAPVDVVWNAFTTAAGVASWLFPFGDDDVELEIGGAALGGHVVKAIDPGRHLLIRVDMPDGAFNSLEYELETRDGGAVLRYVHSGIFGDEGDWDMQFDGASRHTDFYLHSLAQYVEHFPGRAATYVSAMAPDSSVSPGALPAVLAALGLPADVAAGTAVHVELGGAIAPIEGLVDYRTEQFLGIRTDDALYRFFARFQQEAPMFAGHHLFASNVDVVRLDAAWKEWLAGVYATTSVS